MFRRIVVGLAKGQQSHALAGLQLVWGLKSVGLSERSVNCQTVEHLKGEMMVLLQQFLTGPTLLSDRAIVKQSDTVSDSLLHVLHYTFVRQSDSCNCL